MTILDQLEIYMLIQNIQLLKYIAENEGWDVKDMYKYLSL
mgnify:CR=1 FL=1|jgi:hypothetical protein